MFPKNGCVGKIVVPFAGLIVVNPVVFVRCVVDPVILPENGGVGKVRLLFAGLIVVDPVILPKNGGVIVV
jgi:hypothetical protein